MTLVNPLKQVLEASRNLWDHPGTRPSVRENFKKVLICRTAALGAEVYASESQERVVYHTCKSRACPSCGYRNTLLWQRQQWCALPDVYYTGITFTMPQVFWEVFRMNRHLLHDLPALGAEVVKEWVKLKYRVRVLIMVVPHTFGSHLNFNSHLHTLVSASGLKESCPQVVSGLQFDGRDLMRMWRAAVVSYLSKAQAKRVIRLDRSDDEFEKLLDTQYRRKWIIHVDSSMTKRRFLGYAARYVRRPPIAQRRFVKITDGEVQFTTKDKRQKRVVTTCYSVRRFIAPLQDQVPDRYRHAIRYFGLLAPRTKSHTFPALFAVLGQRQRQKPQRLSWRGALFRYFGLDPLLDSSGKSMRWERREAPVGG